MRIDDDDFDLENLELPDRDDDENEKGDEWKTKPLRDAAKPLYKLAMQIYRTTSSIIETMPEDKEELNDYSRWMMENAMNLGAKIRGAMATGDYILFNEKATVIKLAARELMTQCSGLEMFDYKHEDYLDALRSELEEFKKLFVKWVRACPKEEPVWPDGWGLFYTEEDVMKWNHLNPDEPAED